MKITINVYGLINFNHPFLQKELRKKNDQTTCKNLLKLNQNTSLFGIFCIQAHIKDLFFPGSFAVLGFLLSIVDWTNNWRIIIRSAKFLYWGMVFAHFMTPFCRILIQTSEISEFSHIFSWISIFKNHNLMFWYYSDRVFGWTLF